MAELGAVDTPSPSMVVITAASSRSLSRRSTGYGACHADESFDAAS
jgi:hypothetical protein